MNGEAIASFMNNGKVTLFRKEWLEHPKYPMLMYNKISSIQLLSESTKFLFTKRVTYRIVITRNDVDDEFSIKVKDSELKSAKYIVSYIQSVIEARNKKEEKIDDMNVPVQDLNGEKTTVAWYMTVDGNSTCLVTEGGETYHTHVGCYKKWPKDYQKGFKGWKAMRVVDAEAAGLRKCAYCFDADKLTSRSSEFTDWTDFKNRKPVKTFTVTHRDNYALVDDIDIGAEVVEGYDYEKDKETLELNFEEISYMPKNARDFFADSIGDYKMFVLKAYEDSNGKVKVKIGIYEE